MKSYNFFKNLKTLALIPALALAVSCDNNSANNEIDDSHDIEGEGEHYENGEVPENTGANADRTREMREFAMHASSSGMMEVQLAEMAQNRAKNAQVKNLASTIKNDHQKANEQLKSIASTNNWNLSSDMKDEHKEKVEELRNASDNDFDRKFLDIMVESHQDAVNRFERRAEQFEREGEMNGSGNATSTNNNQSTTNNTGSTTNNTSTNNNTGNNTGNTTTGNNTTGNNTSANNTNTNATQTGTQNGGGMELRQWVNQNLPVLREHLRKSEELKNQIGGNNS